MEQRGGEGSRDGAIQKLGSAVSESVMGEIGSRCTKHNCKRTLSLYKCWI